MLSILLVAIYHTCTLFPAAILVSIEASIFGAAAVNAMPLLHEDML